MYARNFYGISFKGDVKASLAIANPGDFVSPPHRHQIRWRSSVSSYIWLLKQTLLLRFAPKRRVVILNFIPLWNFLFFLVVPKSIELGPVTGGGAVCLKHLGGSKLQRLRTHIARSYVVPWLYSLSTAIIYARALKITPATPGVAKALGIKELTPRIIEADARPFHVPQRAPVPVKLQTDLLCYVGDHPLKNTPLTIELINQLAKADIRISVIGALGKDHTLNQDITHHLEISHDAVFGLLGNTKAVLSLSLEQAGFFTYEAAALGRRVLCLPQSGAASLPGAITLIEKDSVVSVDLLYQRCLEVVRTVRTLPPHDATEVSKNTKRIHEHAKSYFYKGK